MKKSLIGIEIGSSEVCMAQLVSGKMITACERLPENLVKDDRVMSPETLAEFLKDMRSGAGFSGKKCSVILPESSTFFRAVSLPVMTEAQVRLNLPYEFRDFVGNDSVRYSYDYALESMEYDENGEAAAMNVLAAAASKTVVSEYRQLLKNSGLRLKTAVPREMALIYLFRDYTSRAGEREHEICLIDMGFDHTRICISTGEKLSASKVIEMGCKQIDEAVASVYNIDKYLAASYRYTNYEKVLESPECKTVYERIALEIMKTVNFYKYENQRADINDVYFCGAGAGIEMLKQEITDFIQFQPKDIHELLPPECQKNPDAWRCLTALGLTLE